MDILLASHNKHKYEEIKNILQKDVNLISLADLKDFDEVIEDGQSFKDNSFIKAKYYYDKYKMNVISDDSGLSVNALGGAPGVYSARYSGNKANDLSNNLLLLKNMEDKTDRRAFFSSSICYIEDGKEFFFEGILDGTIALDIKGEHGFGYDPLFILSDGRRLSNLELNEKNKISHRAIALAKWAYFMKKKVKDNE